MCAYISYLYPSSADGHLCCLHILEIVNNFVMSIEVHVSLQICVFVFDVYPGVEFLGHRLDLFLVCWEASILFSTGAVPFALPQTVQEASLFTKSSWTLVICVLFVDGTFWQVWGGSSLQFWFSFPWWLAALTTFSRARWPSAFPLKKSLFLLFIFFQSCHLFLFDVKLYGLFTYVGC